VTVPVDPPRTVPADGDPRGWRRIASSPWAVAFSVASILTLTVRLVAYPLISSLRLEFLAFGFVSALVAAATVAMPAFLLVPPRRAPRAVDLMVIGFALVAVMQFLATVVTLAFVVSFRSSTPTNGIYALIYLANPALAITAAVGAVLIPFGLVRRIKATAGRSNAAVGCLGVALWLLLAFAVLLGYVTASSRAPLGGLVTIVIGLVAMSGWTGTALYAARHRSRAPGSLRPLALGTGLIAISGAIGAVTTQILTSDPSTYRIVWVSAIVYLGSLLVAVGWGLLLLAAIRGLPGPWWAAPDPPRPDAAATMDDP
jgi:hypothetical protein